MQNEHLAHDAHFYLVGGGIASLAAAAFLIRDGGIRGSSIEILEASGKLGGSLDAGGTPGDGYVMRGGRMFEDKYVCTYDLFSSIPTMDESRTVKDEILSWNSIMKTSSRARLFRKGEAVEAPAFGLSKTHILTIERLELEPEGMLGRSSIEDNFDHEFFATDFWFMWCTTFAFQRWHSAVEFKRYLVRFTHMISGFNTLTGIMRTVFNQYDSLVRPLERWLRERGVRFTFGMRVTDLDLNHNASGFAVQRIFCEDNGTPAVRNIRQHDRVIVTLGSMTEGSTFGSMDRAPALNSDSDSGSWNLWKNIAAQAPGCGNPGNFSDHLDESKWMSFTTTLHDPTFFRLMAELTGNAPGEGGLVSFPESNWLFSIVLPHQPHFPGQPENVQVFWGYGLLVDQRGNFIGKPMSACSGREIMTEILGHLGRSAEQHILASCTCIPCMMPYITSQFLRRTKGDRPDVLPPRATNLAFVGQFCELPDDVVFTVEYSVRSAQTAVYSMLQLPRTPPPMYEGSHHPGVLFQALRALNAGGRDEVAVA